MIKNIICIILFVGLWNCKNKKDVITGKYVGKYSFATEIVELKEGGTYFHSFEYGSKKEENTGKWKLETENSEVRFVMWDWIEYFDTYTLEMNSPPRKTILDTYCDGRMIIMNPDRDDYNLYKLE